LRICESYCKNDRIAGKTVLVMPPKGAACPAFGATWRTITLVPSDKMSVCGSRGLGTEHPEVRMQNVKCGMCVKCFVSLSLIIEIHQEIK
jgi:hypothetical protein